MESKQTIDIAVASYGRQRFLEMTIESIKRETKTPHRIFVADSFCPEEPSMQDWIRGQLGKTISGAVLFDSNVYTRTFDMLYQYFLRSEQIVFTDADLVLPQYQNRCWLQTMCDIIEDETNDFVSLTLLPTVANLGETDKDVLRRSVGRFSTKEEAAQWFESAYRDGRKHETVDNVSTAFPTGVFFQTINRDFYSQYAATYKRFQKDSEIRKYIKKRGKLFGAVLNPCIHLGWEVEDHYNYYLQHKNVIRQSGPPSPYLLPYVGTKYSVYDSTNRLIAQGVLEKQGGRNLKRRD